MAAMMPTSVMAKLSATDRVDADVHQREMIERPTFSLAIPDHRLEFGDVRIRLDTKTSGHLMHRLIAEQGHAQYQPKHLVTRQAPASYGGLGTEIERTGDPFDGNILGEGAEVGEVEEVAEVEQLLLNRHKKSDTRRLVSDFLKTPAWTQMLK